jgi:hypothetical protein
MLELYTYIYIYVCMYMYIYHLTSTVLMLKFTDFIPISTRTSHQLLARSVVSSSGGKKDSNKMRLLDLSRLSPLSSPTSERPNQKPFGKPPCSAAEVPIPGAKRPCPGHGVPTSWLVWIQNASGGLFPPRKRWKRMICWCLAGCSLGRPFMQ